MCPIHRWPARLAALLGVALLVLAGASRTDDLPADGDPDSLIAALTFQDDGGKPLALRDLRDRRALVVVFLSFDCPLCARYAPVLAELAGSYAEHGVAFLGVCSDGDEEPAQLARHRRDFQLPFPIVRDGGHAAADALRAEVTPEAFLLDGDFVVRYRGRIDDGYAARLKPKAVVGRHDLRQALDELLAGKPVSLPATRAYGCPLRGRARPQASGAVTFYRDVLPILQERCQGCHRVGEIGPFALTTYRQAVAWAEDIKTFTHDRKMPPWKPVDGPPFRSERRLTDAERATLAAWVDAGTLEGDPQDAPAPPRFRDGWQLGPPDRVLTVDGDFQLSAGGPDLYRCFVLPADLNEDRYVTAVEVHPGNRRVVHHAVLFVDRKRRARLLERQALDGANHDPGADRGPGYSVALGFAFLPGFLPEAGLGGWAPGQVAQPLPDGAAFYLPKGADIVLQIHYHRSGRVETDRTAVGLYFARGPAARRLQGIVVPANLLYVPAGADRFRVTGIVRVRQDCRLHAVMPHMHMLGRGIKVTMTPPGGRPRTLVAITDWDFNWQETYFFQESIPVRAGTRFEIEGVYDNSAGNPNNPNRPPRTVWAGLETTNEMCVGFLAATADQPGPIRFDVAVPIPGLGELQTVGIPGFGL